MQPTLRRLLARVWLPFVLLIPVLVATKISRAADSTAIQIVPGPRSMSAEEKALGPDPSQGSQHGIILVDETIRDESAGADSNVFRHVRAKIFSNEARTLGDVEIPFNRTRGVLKKWWGTTLLPDGTLLEVKQSDLKEQELARSGGNRVVVLKASLPGLAPGCIIDYGYYLEERGIYESTRVDIQRETPVKEFRYRWAPYNGQTASFRLTHNEGLRITTTRDRRSLLLTGKEVPAVLDEPYMPPEKESHASAVFYYRTSGEEPDEFWKLTAKRLSRDVEAFIKEKPIAQALAGMNLPADANLKTRLRAAYDWASTHIKNTTQRTSEQAEADADDKAGKSVQRRTVVELMNTREGTSRELAYLFYGLSRALGAEASLVLATDRANHYFDPGYLSVRQFDWMLIGVKGPGEPDDKLVYVDLGSGLPFGEIPWWFTGSRAFLATPDGYRLVTLYPADPKQNLLETKVKTSFNLAEGTARTSWTSDGSGQQGLAERWRLRGMNPEERGKELERYCGASGDFEISRAEAPRLQELTASYHLECDGVLMNTNLTPDLGRYTWDFTGPWVEGSPRFTAPTRSQNVIFPFPRVDKVIIDVRSPEGFSPVGVPPVPPVDSPFGRYALLVETTREGYHVERLFAMAALVVPPKDYDALRRFFSAVAQADSTPLEFRRQAAP